ncbi:MAG: acetyl-CoA carboxylase carboxyl transferase subunit alpha [Firmicutes bacterium HGW-Firmicutes-7]|nr:MAG: acetyl-CoA carboxylase carboxyl transferase subunit alpha [Firmicutes bacterium HGW-Firmicutes-7]
MLAWEKVQKARRIDRPTSIDYIEKIVEDFIEFHGDRLYEDDHAIIGGIGRIGSINVTVIAQEKGKNTTDKVMRNFAMPNPEGYRKALRLMKQAEKFNRPIICFVDTPGAYPGIGAEERGQGEAIARNLLEMSKLKVPIISIIIGEGGSGGALALAVADEVWMLENAIYSILSPEGYASILYKDSSKAKEIADEMKLTAEDLLELGVVDRIIKEPLDGAHVSFNPIAKGLKELLIEHLTELQAIETNELIGKRYDKFRKFY